MELKEYIALIARNKVLIVSMAILVLIAAGIFTMTRKSVYLSSMTLNITPAQRAETIDYQYDGYYALQASELFANTVQSWMESPDVVVSIFNDAKLPTPTDNIKKLGKIFTASKLSSQNLEVRFTTESSEDAAKLVTGIRDTIEARTKTVNETSKGTTGFSIIYSQAITKEVKQDLTTNLLVGAVIGIILGMTSAFVKEYAAK